MTKKTYSVYHIFDNRTDGSLTDGYIGYTRKLVKDRVFQHRYTGYNTGATTSYARPMYLKLAEIPEECISYRTIATFDSEGLAADYERYLRPKSNMGWNKTKGGQKYTLSTKLVIVKPDGTEGHSRHSSK